MSVDLSNAPKIKQQLARIFKDDLQAKDWTKYVNFVILFFIILSVISVFLSTYDDLAVKYAGLITFINVITVAFFTVEVSLRIWCADLLDHKYQGFIGRVRYCFSFLCKFYRFYDYAEFSVI